MIPCPHCGAYVTEGRTICKACGRDINKPLGSPAEAPAAAPAPPKKSIHPLLIIGGAILGVIILSVALGSRGRTPAPARANNDPIAAYVACKDFVGNHLKAPTQAEWPTANDADIVTLGGGKWRVTSYVDAPNAFGTMLRNDYSCEVTLTPGKWTGNKLIFGGEQVYP